MQYFDEYFQTIFPRLDVVKLLLDCGAYVDARNTLRSTPLHIASNAYNFHNAVSILFFIYFLEFYKLNITAHIKNLFKTADKIVVGLWRTLRYTK